MPRFSITTKLMQSVKLHSLSGRDKKQSQTFGKQVFSHMDDFQSTLLFGNLNLGNELPGEVSQPQSAQTVANFHKDIIGCDHPCTLLLQVSVEGSSLFVISVVSVSQSDPAETVHKNFPRISPHLSFHPRSSSSVP
jgi:hypothetical protein